MVLSPRDLALLQLLDRTPATAAHILKASVTFGQESFSNERRVRERTQSLVKMHLVRNFSLALSGGGLANYYRPAPEGYRVVHGPEAELPHRSFFASLPPSRLLHTMQLADAIVHALVCAYIARIKLTGFHRENELILEVGSHRTTPDCHFQFLAGGKTFNVLFELDRSSESLDSLALNSIRRKLVAYEAYQDYAWALWKQGGKHGTRPYFRVAFLTATLERAHNVLALARQCAGNVDRRLCYASTLDSFLTERDAMRFPLFLDHHGHWQALVNIFPTAHFMRKPTRIPPLKQSSLPI